MNISYKPLEESVLKLASCVKHQDVRGFEEETKVFYEQMGRLSRYHWMPEVARELVTRYQSQYDQLKQGMVKR